MIIKRTSNSERQAPHSKSPILPRIGVGCYRTIACLGLLVMTPAVMATENVPLEFRQDQIPYNFQSREGVPISGTTNNPAGSNGQLPPATSNESGSSLAATDKQFRSFISFGAVAAATNSGVLHSNSINLVQSPFNSNVATAMQLPIGRSNSVTVMIVRRAQVGAPYLSRPISFLFGGLIPVPDTDENGITLTNIVPEQYWLAEPYTTTGHTNDFYYWSPNAQKVYAIQAGPITITWKKNASTNGVPSDYSTNPPNYSVENGHYARLYSKTYIVSGSPAKPPRKIYWTESDTFSPLGKLIKIPTGVTPRVVYNNNFPQFVDSEYVSPGNSPKTTNDFQNLKTLYVDNGNLHSYNIEGRVFVELLGDIQNGQSSVQLGFEIVDVYKHVNPADVTIELGERLTPPSPGTLDSLSPEPVNLIGDSAQLPPFGYAHTPTLGTTTEYYANRETQNVNDYLVHWMEKGEAGLKWPSLLARYKLIWPSDISRYSQYIRPLVFSENDAMTTAVQLVSTNAPAISWQDDYTHPRAKITADTKFYTWITNDFPAHRTLLRFGAGGNIAFERVFSWLDSSLQAELATAGHGNFGSTVATNLDSWTSSNTLVFADSTVAPRVINQTVFVGDRIIPPSGEIGSTNGSTYYAGYIWQPGGTLFNPNAYIDPFVAGADAASKGSIIPVNAIPNANKLEVWWFRRNHANSVQGFASIYWPSVIGHYTIQWPSNPLEIVLAGNQGSAGNSDLDPLIATGTIYSQNNLGLPGYNPNEEHAVMVGGTAYALRDDLNSTNTPNYSSAPFVMVDYKASDGRASMAVFKVLRERPEKGWIFDYIVKAGSLLQAPMPMPQLPPPIEGSGDAAINYNSETMAATPGDLPVGWLESRDATNVFGHYKKFTYRDRKQGFWVYRGPHAGLPALQAGTYVASNNTFTNLSTATAVVGNPFVQYIHASRQDQYLSMQVTNGIGQVVFPQWLHVQGLVLQGTPTTNDVGTNTIQIVVRDNFDGMAATNNLTIVVAASGSVTQQGRLTVHSTNSYTGAITDFTNRPPFLANSPTPTNSFTMRFYYKNQAGFDWPGLGAPTVGSIVPYLRSINPTNNTYIGDAASKTNALDIVYRPVWPETDPLDESMPLPKLPYGQTLTDPITGLPGVRDFKTANILYQESIATNNITNNLVSAVLFDPTRQKIADLKAAGMTSLPPSVQTDVYQGKSFFPKLPPHLSSRLFIDPNMGTNGSLIFQGEFKDEIAGEKYVLLNVLADADLAAVNNLCSPNDLINFPLWTNLVGKLATKVETLVENTYIYTNVVTNVTTTFNYTTNFYATGGFFIGSGSANNPYNNTQFSYYIVTNSSTVTTFTTNVVVTTNGLGTFSVASNLTSVVGIGALAVVTSDNSTVDSYALSAAGPGGGYITLIENGGTALTDPGDPVALHIIKVGGSLYSGELKVLPPANPLSEQVTIQHTGDFGGHPGDYEFDWLIQEPVAGVAPPVPGGFNPLVDGNGLNRYLLGGAGVQTLSDQYLVMRYRPINPRHPLYKASPSSNDWSGWTQPVLVEGWIKRVLAGINPFNQRTSDFFNNRVNTDATIIQAAGHRWEGDIALNSDTLNDFGLIEIYETVLRRGRSLSIEASPPINDTGANNALMLAAGYLSDLYMMLGNEGFADANNPTIGISTKDSAFGDIATSLFSFEGQVPTLIEEQLAMLRGRDDSLAPSVQVPPFYNRLFWNYTRGIDSGEVIYALNYDIKDLNNDGIVDASDAAKLYPQAHGDAYGHYLTALKGHFSLLMNNSFTWVPQIEAVSVLGQTVAVDYRDERKFAAAAAAVARSGQEIFNLTWRRDWQPASSSFSANGRWDWMSTNRVSSRVVTNLNGNPTNPVRYWGVDHWATRVGQGQYINWVVGNALLPANDFVHEGIQKIDRTTVPELQELAVSGNSLQSALDNAEGGSTPLNLPEGSIAFDIDPNQVVGGENGTHFEQIYQRATVALKNAVGAFDEAKNVTHLMRQQTDSLDDLRYSILRQEIAYTNALIELYGTPYPDDIGPGRTYPQNYAGPDLIHFAYADTPQMVFDNLPSPTNQFQIQLGTHEFLAGNLNQAFNTKVEELFGLNSGSHIDTNAPPTLTFTLDPFGNFAKPAAWTSKRASPGKVQAATSQILLARNSALEALQRTDDLQRKLQNGINFLDAKQTFDENDHRWDVEKATLTTAIEAAKVGYEIYKIYDAWANNLINNVAGAIAATVPDSTIVGLADGGDILSAARGAILAQKAADIAVLNSTEAIVKTALLSFTTVKEAAMRFNEILNIAPERIQVENRRIVAELDATLGEVQTSLYTINQRLQELTGSMRIYRELLGQGDRLLAERQVFRQRSAELIQGYRTRDASFRLFRDEKLERYNTLFDLASRYAYLAANAYDYETGLLGTDQGHSFLNRIMSSRALGVVHQGQPQFAGSDTGDPGLSSALAEMKADWDVVKGRLGFNNPDAYGTTVSLRSENFRILPDTNGLSNWQNTMRQCLKDNVLDDADVRRYCMQIDPGNGLPVPGIVFEFSTVIATGFNLFGQPLAAGDHGYSSSSFATKIFAAGIALEGYRGMDNPAANTSGVGSAGGTSPNDPTTWYLDPLALSATPYVYLVPVGIDVMRSPPLGDISFIRNWTVADAAIPLPFNIGASDFSTTGFYLSSDSLTEPLFALRKHQAFRPVSSPSFFSTSLYGQTGNLLRSQYTNNRLVGRSVWNTKWKLVIPGNTLLNNPGEGLNRFMQTVTDVKIHFVTYSYSGN